VSNPTEQWPTDATIVALDGTTDGDTGLPYVAKTTNPSSTPSLEVQFNRRLHRQNAMLATINACRVVQVDDTHIGVFGGRFRIGSADLQYSGQGSIAIASDDVWYVYLDANSDDGSNDVVQVVTDATGWPADKALYIPLAEVTMAASEITGIVDVRDLAIFSAGNTVSVSQITGVTDANILVASGTTLTAAAMSGDATIANTGAVTIGASAITTGKIAAGAVTTAKIAASAITATEIAAGAVGTSELATDAVTNVKIATGAVDADELATSAVISAKIAAGAVTTAKIATSAITAGQIAADAIVTVGIINGAVGTAKLGQDITTAGKAILDDANAAAQRTTLGLGAMATKATVATTDIDNNAVTVAKLATAVMDRRIVQAHRSIISGDVTNEELFEFDPPTDMTLEEVQAYCSDVGVGATVDVMEAGTTVLSSPISLSSGAIVKGTVSDSAISASNNITVVITITGSHTIYDITVTMIFKAAVAG